jgi:hypothetical protein
MTFSAGLIHLMVVTAQQDGSLSSRIFSECISPLATFGNVGKQDEALSRLHDLEEQCTGKISRTDLKQFSDRPAQLERDFSKN